MEIEDAKKLIESTDDDNSVKNAHFKGLQIINKFMCSQDLVFAGTHDQIFVGDFEYTVQQMSEEEVKELASYGFFEDEDSWSFFT